MSNIIYSRMKPGVEQFVVIYDAKSSTHYHQCDWALLKEVIKLQEYYPGCSSFMDDD